MAVTSFGEVVGFSDVAYTWTLDNYRYLWDDFFGDFHLYRDIFLEKEVLPPPPTEEIFRPEEDEEELALADTDLDEEQ